MSRLPRRASATLHPHPSHPSNILYANTFVSLYLTQIARTEELEHRPRLASIWFILIYSLHQWQAL